MIEIPAYWRGSFAGSWDITSRLPCNTRRNQSISNENVDAVGYLLKSGRDKLDDLQRLVLFDFRADNLAAKTFISAPCKQLPPMPKNQRELVDHIGSTVGY